MSTLDEGDLVVVKVDTATYFNYGVAVSKTGFARTDGGTTVETLHHALTVDEPLIMCKYSNDAIEIADWLNTKRRKNAEAGTRV
jgi:hypothetical protein